MRKIIITVIATIVLTASFEKAKGQWQEQTVITSADFPTVNVLTGVNTKLSVGIWRFDVFAQIGGYLQMFEERMMMEGAWLGEDGTLRFSRNEFHSPRFERTAILDYGIGFRVTDRHRVKIGLMGMPFKIIMTNAMLGSIQGITNASPDGIVQQLYDRGHDWRKFYLRYSYGINLSQRVRLDLNVQYGTTFENGSDTWARFGSYNILFQHISFGTKLSYEIARNLKLNARLRYTRRYSVRGVSWRPLIENIESIFTRNLVDFSIGIHYHIPIFGVQHQQAQPRPPRQRVAPHQRALPCPPGQMRHGRSWDRPSSVFNHPKAR